MSKKTTPKTVKQAATNPAVLPDFPAPPAFPKSPSDQVFDAVPEMMANYRKLIVGQDIAGRAAMAALPAVVAQGGVHSRAEEIVNRAFQIGDRFAAMVAAREAAGKEAASNA